MFIGYSIENKQDITVMEVMFKNMKECVPSNQWVVLILRLAQKVSDLSISLFVTLYLWDVTGNDLFTICKYKIAFVLSVLAAMFAFIYLSKHPKRKLIMIAGRLVQLVYAVVLTVLGDSCIQFIIPLGILDGVGTGMYYVIYNQWEVEGASNTFYGRSRYQGVGAGLSAIIKIGFPIITGYLVSMFGMTCIFCYLMLVEATTLIMAIMYKDTATKGLPKVSFTGYFKSLTSDGVRDMKLYAFIDMFRGIIRSYGSFELFVQICLLGYFAGSVEFGTANSVVYLMTMVIGFGFSSICKRGDNVPATSVRVLWLAYFVAGVAAMVSGKGSVFIAFVVVYNILLQVESLMYGTATGCCVLKHAKDYMTEAYVINECFLVIGRVLGYGSLMLLYKTPGSFGTGYKELIVFTVYAFAFLIGLLLLIKLWDNSRDKPFSKTGPKVPLTIAIRTTFGYGYGVIDVKQLGLFDRACSQLGLRAKVKGEFVNEHSVYSMVLIRIRKSDIKLFIDVMKEVKRLMEVTSNYDEDKITNTFSNMEVML